MRHYKTQKILCGQSPQVILQTDFLMSRTIKAYYEILSIQVKIYPAFPVILFWKE